MPSASGGCASWQSSSRRAGSKQPIHYRRDSAPGFIFSAGITPANGQAAHSALKYMLAEPERVERLQHDAQVFPQALVDTAEKTVRILAAVREQMPG